MAVINVRDIIRYSAPLFNLRGDLPDGYYNFRNVSIYLKDESLVPLDVFSPKRKSKTKVVFQKTNDRAPEALAMLRATDESICSGRILLEMGVITGLDESLITIPLEVVGLQQFGIDEDLELDLSRPVCYEKEFERPAPASDEQYISHESSAIVYCTEEKMKGFFQCEVIMEGLVTINYNGRTPQIPIATAVAVLEAKDHESVQGLRSDGKTVEFTVKGEMNFRRPRTPEIEWQ